MQIAIPAILLWLFVVNLGIVVGAGWYELRIVVPFWRSAPPRSIGVPESGLRFWAWVASGPLTLLTIANLVAAWQAQGSARAWWLFVSGLVAIERVVTFSYFVPTIMRLQRDQAAPPALAKAAFDRWSALNYLRNIASLLAWLGAIRALTLLHAG